MDGSIGDPRTCLSMECVQVIFTCLLQWRVYWSRTCLSNSSASRTCLSKRVFSFLQSVLVMKWRVYWWSRTSVDSLQWNGVCFKVTKNVSVKLVKRFFQFLQWRREYLWSRTCLSNSSASFMEGVLVITNVSLKLFSSLNGECIGDQERVCQTLQLLQWRVYWWSRTCLSNSSAPSMESVLVIKNVSVKLFSFFNGGCIGDQERVCKTLRFLQWSVYRWSRTCLSKSSASLMDGIFVIMNVSVKLFSFINGGCIGEQ